MAKYSEKSWSPWIGVILFLSSLCGHGEAFQNQCHREPQNTMAPKNIGDGGYQIKISGNPDKYLPGELYKRE